MKGFIIDARHKTLDDKTFIQLFGKLEDGKSFSTINKFRPYLFIEESNLKKASHLLKKFQTEKTNLKSFAGKSVTKVSADTQPELSKLFSALEKKNIPTFEADIKPTTQFMIEHNLLGTLEIKGDSTSEERVDRFFLEPELKPGEYNPELKILSLDIETTSKHNGDLFCIGLYSKNYVKNFALTDQKITDTVSCKTEAELLSKFKEEIIRIDPDIIIGWNLIDFDFAYLREKFEKHKIPFDIGRDNQNIRLRIETGFFRTSSVDISGRQVLDALSLIRDPFIKEAPSIKHAKFDSFTLEDVSQEILGEGKLLKGKKRHEQIEEMFNNKKHKDLVEYNVQDCKLVYDIVKKTDMINLAIERSTLTGMQLDRLTASIAAFDSLYIREAHKKGFVSPSNRYSGKEERLKGGYVMESTPGIYHNVIVLDFKSLYPSIIKTFNIDPASFIKEAPKKKDKSKVVESPNNAYFINQDGILPEIIEKLHQAREKAKREKRELASYAIKIIMNSFWGVLASPNCRYFNFEMASAITSFARFIIQLTAKKVEEQGYSVIYSDTDSVFVHTDAGKEKADRIGKEIEKYINEFYHDYVKNNYERKSYLELQFEKQYISFLMPSLRKADSEIGSKKRYAGLIEKNGKENIQIVGLEAIRGDWTEAAKDFQKELLNKIFHKEEFAQFIKDYVKKIRDGKMDNKLVYSKSIRKSLEKYTKTTPPHVKAARQLDTLDSNVIKYYMTEAGPEPIQKHKHRIDYDHYINKQIKPIANTILFFFHKDFEEIISSSTQTKLF